MDTLPALLESQARASGERPAILDGDGSSRTYAALAADVRTIAAGLAAMGVQRADRVAIVLPNGPDAAIGFLGAATAAAAAPLNPAYGREEFVFYFEDLATRLAIVDPQAAPAAVEAARTRGVRVVTLDECRRATGVDRNATAPAPDHVALVLHTSGTTSRPKIVPLTHANLTCNAQNIARSLALTPDDRCLNVMPLFHVHGLVGAVLGTLAAGGSVVCTPGLDAAMFFTWLRAFSPTWYTAVPTMHQAVLARLPAAHAAGHVDRRVSPSAGATNSQPAGLGHAGGIAPGDATVETTLRFIRSCSSALPPKLMGELEAAFGVPVIEALGMTEASHQVASNPLPPRARKPGSVGVATGPEIGIMDEAGNLLPAESTGEVVLRGPNITRGYASPPEANAKAFAHGWFRTGDQGKLDGEGYLFLTGRLKEIINRGGEKVSPREIDEALLEHPAVAQAVAFAMPHATLGEDVAAAVVLRPNVAASGDAIREFAFGRLAAFKVPSVVLVVDAIPKGPTGKLQRIGLVEKLRDRLATAFVAPRDDVEALVADTWQEVLGRERVGVHDNFFVIGGDSLRGTRVMARLNELFATDLPVSTAFRQPTVAQLADRIRAEAPPDQLAVVSATLAEIRGLTEEEAKRALGENSG